MCDVPFMTTGSHKKRVMLHLSMPLVPRLTWIRHSCPIGNHGARPAARVDQATATAGGRSAAGGPPAAGPWGAPRGFKDGVLMICLRGVPEWVWDHR